MDGTQFSRPRILFNCTVLVPCVSRLPPVSFYRYVGKRVFPARCGISFYGCWSYLAQPLRPALRATTLCVSLESLLATAGSRWRQRLSSRFAKVLYAASMERRQFRRRPGRADFWSKRLQPVSRGVGKVSTLARKASAKRCCKTAQTLQKHRPQLMRCGEKSDCDNRSFCKVHHGSLHHDSCLT